MINEIKQPTLVAKIFIVALIAGFAVMLISSGAYRTNHPSLTKIKRSSAPQQSVERSAEDTTAIAELMGNLRDNPDDVKTIKKIARRFMNMKEYKEARSILKKGVAIDPKNGPLYCQLGISNFQLKNYEEAVSAFETAISLQDDPSAQYNLGILFKYYLDRPEEAKAQFTEVVNSTTAPAGLKNSAQKELEG